MRRERRVGRSAPGPGRTLGSLLLLLLTAAASVRAQEESTGSIQGRLTQGEPLSGALVTVKGGSATDTTDRDGNFLLSGVPAGTRIVEARHPRLTRLGLTPLQHTVEVRAGETVRLDLPVPHPLPSTRSVLSRLCPDGPAGSGAFRGRLIHRETGEPLRDVRVRIAWSDSAAGPEPESGSRLARTDSAGRFTVCGVPRGSAVQALVGTGRYGRLTGTVRMPDSGLLSREITYSTSGGARDPAAEPSDEELVAGPDSTEFVLEPLTVRIQRNGLAGFRHRRETRKGHFFTREEILSTDPARLSEVFEDQDVPKVRVQYDPAGHVGLYRVKLFDAEDGWGQMWCTPQLYVDGRRIPPAFMNEGHWSLDAYAPEKIVAMEVYWLRGQAPRSMQKDVSPQLERLASSGTPMLYGGNTNPASMSEGFMETCGTILLWTEKSGTLEDVEQDVP